MALVSTDFEIGELSRVERLEYLRRKIAAVPAKGESVAEALPSDTREVLAVPGPLAELLPRHGLARGSVSVVSGTNSLLLGILAAVTNAGMFAAVVGLPKLGLLAAAEMGARFDRLALIPEAGPDPAGVAAVLLDGIDLVVLGLGGASVAPTRARAVVARARSKRAALLIVDGQLPGAEVLIDARVEGYSGLGQGVGRVHAVQLSVRTQSKAFGSRSGRFDLRTRSEVGVEWCPNRVAQPEAVAL
ncbi:hypothetical protein [Smaragdicoccus niigatensis]|uniref:hypothetical protein n=1 Tax=Smaragdicoccus niigatensis TaxID=359359 RepID=UPI00039F8576|nr:hypothetical protein [Smaragdicoccus niigatensis]